MAIIKELGGGRAVRRIENQSPSRRGSEELNTTDGFEQAAVAGRRLERGRRAPRTGADAMILDRAIVAASFVTRGAAILAQPVPCDEQFSSRIDPMHRRPPARRTTQSMPRGMSQIDVFHACALAQHGELEAGRETFGVSFGGFADRPAIRRVPRTTGHRESSDRRCSSKALAIPVKPSVI